MSRLNRSAFGRGIRTVERTTDLQNPSAEAVSSVEAQAQIGLVAGVKDGAVDLIWNKVPEPEPAQDWFTYIIRTALHARVQGIEPAPTTWDTVQRRIEALFPSLSHQGEVCKRRRQND